MNPFKWIFKKSKIKVNIDATVMQGNDVCDVKIIEVEESSMKCITKKLIFGKSRICQGDSYKIEVVIKEEKHLVDGNLGFVNFSFEKSNNDQFLLHFTTNSVIYDALKKQS